MIVKQRSLQIRSSTLLYCMRLKKVKLLPKRQTEGPTGLAGYTGSRR